MPLDQRRRYGQEDHPVPVGMAEVPPNMRGDERQKIGQVSDYVGNLVMRDGSRDAVREEEVEIPLCFKSLVIAKELICSGG